MPKSTIRIAMAAGFALGAGLLTGLPLASRAQPSAIPSIGPVSASSPAPAAAQPIPGSPMAAILTTLPDGKQQALLIDGQRQVFGVYHIHPTSGEISLKAVRNFRYDLQMDEFGTSSPSPREIRAMLPRD